MNYLAAVQGTDINNAIQAGNASFECDGPLTKGVLDEVKRRHCDQLLTEGIEMNPDKMMILAVINMA